MTIASINKLFNIKQNILDAIICKELSISKEKLFLLNEIDDKYLKNIKKSVTDFKSGVPLEYILEKANFFGLDFFVDKRVLIPRNDTEIMVKEVLNEAKMHKNITLFDIGTGSSNIAISCLLNDSNFKKAFLIDKSKKALEIAKINVKRYDLNNKIKIINGDLLNTDISIGDEEVLIITANLPYIKNGDFKNMSTETLKYEPKMALFGGKKTGFELYEKLIKQIRGKYKKFVSTKIILFIEIGFDQYEYSKKYLENLGLEYKYFKDNSGIWRCIKIFIH